jgi:hypothetical protein
MKIKRSKSAAEENLIGLLSEGYELRRTLWEDYSLRTSEGTWRDPEHYKPYVELVNKWADKVVQELGAIFPTNLEANYFLDKRSHLAMDYAGLNQKFGHLYQATFPTLIDKLEQILNVSLKRYSDLPAKMVLYVEDIDSFHYVRDMNAKNINHLLKNGYLDISEDAVQIGIEQILDVSFHKKDWGGERNDLYSANVVLNGARVSTAFLLKGNGCKATEMTIADCGKNGDQILRLFESPAKLFVIQYVGNISENVITDATQKMKALNLSGHECRLLIIDGQDTARLLHAYGKI